MLQYFFKDDFGNQIEWHGSKYSIGVPRFASWDEQNRTLQMEYCSGNNLETELKIARGTERIQFVDFSVEIFEWMRNRGFLWRDAAPRNTLIDTSSKRVILVDFERPLVLNPEGFEREDFNLLVRGNIHEEFSGFLFQEEQDRVFPNIWEGNENTYIDKQSILSGRQLLLLTYLYGEQGKKVKATDLAHAQKMMSDTVTPFNVDGEPFFPLIYLEKAPTAKDYIDKVIELQNSPREVWKEILKV